jgi:uncharacterized DUF497 family protein
MNFEFEPGKSAVNLAKHGIDFVTAQAIWSDPDRLVERRDQDARPAPAP